MGRITMSTATSVDGFKSKEIFDAISKSLAEDGKTLVGKVKGIYGFKVKGGPDNKEGFWIVDVTLTISDGDLVDLMTGKLNSQKAFFQGKLKVQGNMGLAMKLQEFQKKAPKSKL